MKQTRPRHALAACLVSKRQRPDKGGAGRGAAGLSFQVGHLGRAVPDLVRLRDTPNYL
jgi:hypothetical protein